MKITYNGKCDFRLDDELVIEKFDDKQIEKAIIKASSGDFSVTFYTSYSDENRALNSTSAILEEYRKIFLFETGFEIRDIHCTSIGQEEKNKVVLGSRAIVKAELTVIRHLENQNDIKRMLETYKNDDFNDYANIFTNVCAMKDLIGKYILLYSILSALKGPQREVDKYIRSIEPNVEMRKTTKPNANYDETIYTYLRNQIGHTTDKTDTTKLNDEVLLNIGGLREIVKKAIKDLT
jgi:hypothetical protein